MVLCKLRCRAADTASVCGSQRQSTVLLARAEAWKARAYLVQVASHIRVPGGQAGSTCHLRVKGRVQHGRQACLSVQMPHTHLHLRVRQLLWIQRTTLCDTVASQSAQCAATMSLRALTSLACRPWQSCLVVPGAAVHFTDCSACCPWTGIPAAGWPDTSVDLVRQTATDASTMGACMQAEQQMKAVNEGIVSGIPVRTALLVALSSGGSCALLLQEPM